MDELGSLEPGEVLEALAHLPVSVAVIDARGAVRYVNAAAEGLYGWRADEVIGRGALALGVAPTETSAAADLLAKLQLGETWRGRFPLLRSNGRRIPAWMAVVSLPVAEGDEESKLLVVAIDAEDLHENPAADRQAAEGRAEDANRLVQGILDAVPVGMAFFDRSLRYVRVNEAMAETTGFPADAHVGRTFSEVLGRPSRQLAEDIASVFATGETIRARPFVGETPAMPGVVRHWEVSYFAVRRGAEVGWVGAAAVDVTERARLLESERAARLEAEETVERLARLQIVTGRLAEAADLAEVADVVVRYGGEGVGAQGGALCIVEADRLRIIDAVGMNPDAIAQFASVPLDAGLPGTDAVRLREMVVISSVAERDARYPDLAPVTPTNRAFAAVPMVIDGIAIGCITFAWAQERTLDRGEEHFLLALGRQAAQALERSRLYEAERRARAAAEEAGERMRFLAEASRVLGSSLDYDVTLSEMAALAVPTLADVCLVHLFDGDDLRLVIVTHRDPVLGRRLAAVTDRPKRDREPRLLGRAAVLGESLVLDEVPDAVLSWISEGEAQLEVLRSLELCSGLVVPLRGQAGICGVLTLAADSTSGRRFRADDLPFVEDLAGRAAVAIENAQSHQARSEVAQTLQRSLLPPHLPQIAGLELAQRYHSLGDVEVGGDFFDVFPAGDGCWGVVIGDVCGKGVAAASLTALARYTVRAGAIDSEPASVLRLLNRAILDADVGERFCTISHAMVEPAEGSARMVLACGGHPRPLLLTAGGEVRPVGVPGTAIGLFEEIDLTEVEVILGEGDALAFYTDGFTEARSPEGRFDPGLLVRALGTATGQTAEGIAETIDRAVLDFECGRQRDDMALLVLRVRPRS